MNLNELIMLDIRIFNDEPVTKLNDELKSFINKFKPFGIILFANNFVDKVQGKQLIDEIRQIHPKIVIAIDQEGGIVTRINGATNFTGAMSLGATNDSNYAYLTGKQIGNELNAIGVDINFGPVCDINSNPNNPVINVRSFSSDAKVVSEFANQYAKGLHDGGVLSCFKHFPGHGDVDVDSHFGLPVSNKSEAELLEMELIPFINANSQLFMNAHIAFNKIDDETFGENNFYMPTTLSTKIISTLKKHIRKDAIFISDAMNMKAISDNFSEEEAFVKSVEAGMDIVCMPYNIDNSEKLSKYESFINKCESLITDESSFNRAIENSRKIIEMCILKTHSLECIKNDYAKNLELEIALKSITNFGNKFEINSEIKTIYVNDLKTSNYNVVISKLYKDIKFTQNFETADIIIFDSQYEHEQLVEEINKLNNKVIVHVRSPYIASKFNKTHQHIFTYGFLGRVNGPDSESGGNIQDLINLYATFKIIKEKGQFVGKLPIFIGENNE